MRLLIAGSDRKSARLLEEQLRSAGYEVAVAFDAREALLQVEMERPDAILMDAAALPGAPELLRNLKANPETAGIPVLASLAALCCSYSDR